MTEARQVAVRLAKQFYIQGRFAALDSPLSPQSADALLAAVTTNQIGYGQKALLPAASDTSLTQPGSDSHFTQLAVQAVGVGLTEAPDSGSAVPSVVVYVTRNAALTRKLLGQEIDGVPVRVVAASSVMVKPEHALRTAGRGHYFVHQGRVACGSSCAPAREPLAGTLGALVTRGNQIFILSNNHVIGGCNHLERGMPILSPANDDCRADLAPRDLARHALLVPLVSGEPSQVPAMATDAALARVIDSDAVSSWQGDAEAGYDTPTSVVDPEPGQLVQKVGRTTGHTHGKIEAEMVAPVPLVFESRHFRAKVYFDGLWVVAKMAGQPFVAAVGDSGSLVVTDDAQAAVGLILATSQRGDKAWIMPIRRVLADLGCRLLGNHHVGTPAAEVSNDALIVT